MGLLWDSEDEKSRRRELQMEARWLKSDYEYESRSCANLVKDTLVNFFINRGLLDISGTFQSYAMSQSMYKVRYYCDAYDYGDYDRLYDSLMSDWYSIRSKEDPDLAKLGSSSYKEIVGWVGSYRSFADKECISLVYKGGQKIKPGEAFMAAFDGAFKLHKMGNGISSNEEQLKAALEQLQNYRG